MASKNKMVPVFENGSIRLIIDDNGVFSVPLYENRKQGDLFVSKKKYFEYLHSPHTDTLIEQMKKIKKDYIKNQNRN